MAGNRVVHRTLRLNDGAYVVELSGELDGRAAAALERFAGERVVVDLLDVRSIEPEGLEALLRACERNRVTVVADDPWTLCVLDLSGATRAFDLRRTLSEAIAV